MAEMTIAPVATHGFFVDGRWQQDGDLVDIRAPYDGTLIARVTQGRKEHAEAAIAAQSRHSAPPPPSRLRAPAVLRQISALIVERKEEFARTLAQEAGAHQSCPD
jgi:acyl-CoA reductase-like NAD-dependent aldehyde dehydrogenase